MSVPAALGLDPTVANSVHRVINSSLGSILPSGLQKTILDGIFAIGRVQVSDSILNEKNPFGSSRLAKLKRILDEGKSLQLQFPAEDLGFRYLEGALVRDNSCPVTPEAPTGRRRDHVPLAEPGARLPHMRVRMLPKSTTEETLSTLDLVSGDELEFLLIIAPKKKSYNFAQAAFKVAQEFQVALKVCIMWSNSSSKGMDGSRAALVPWENFIDVEEVKGPLSLSWWDICKMTSSGAILIRPDEHIAWRSKDEVFGDPSVEMDNVFSQILGAKKIHA